ncbi:MAG: ExbD/TolR family protein [Paracoccaceae bacterium]|nr:ExbD/TolR family protein [Paracoccaceae bacterium]
MTQETWQRENGSRSGRFHRGGRAKYRPMAEINVTPFVDVMLVLLVIFMVAAPLLTVGVNVDLPETAARPLPTVQEEPLTVFIDSDGRIFIQDSEIEPELLEAKLREIVGERSGRTIFLKADRTTAYAEFMQVVGAMAAGGFNNLSLVTDGGGPRLDELGEDG